MAVSARPSKPDWLKVRFPAGERPFTIAVEEGRPLPRVVPPPATGEPVPAILPGGDGG